MPTPKASSRGPPAGGAIPSSLGLLWVGQFLSILGTEVRHLSVSCIDVAFTHLDRVRDHLSVPYVSVSWQSAFMPSRARKGHLAGQVDLRLPRQPNFTCRTIGASAWGHGMTPLVLFVMRLQVTRFALRVWTYEQTHSSAQFALITFFTEVCSSMGYHWPIIIIIIIIIIISSSSSSSTLIIVPIMMSSSQPSVSRSAQGL
jgi:hypothetical protein